MLRAGDIVRLTDEWQKKTGLMGQGKILFFMLSHREDGGQPQFDVPVIYWQADGSYRSEFPMEALEKVGRVRIRKADMPDVIVDANGQFLQRGDTVKVVNEEDWPASVRENGTVMGFNDEGSEIEAIVSFPELSRVPIKAKELVKMGMNKTAMDNFTRDYLVTALWASTDEQGEPLDSMYSVEELDPEYVAKVERECQDFQSKAQAAGLQLNDDAAHDFFLTRNHHGAGFWDGDYDKEIGNKLTEIAHSFGEDDPLQALPEKTAMKKNAERLAPGDRVRVNPMLLNPDSPYLNLEGTVVKLEGLGVDVDWDREVPFGEGLEFADNLEKVGMKKQAASYRVNPYAEASGTERRGSLTATYAELEAAFGPAHAQGDKTNFEWYFSDDQGHTFTIYDFDAEEVSPEERKQDGPHEWSVGAYYKVPVEDFIQWVQAQI